MYIYVTHTHACMHACMHACTHTHTAVLWLYVTMLANPMIAAGVCQTANSYFFNMLLKKPSPQSNLRRARRKGPIGSDDIGSSLRYSPSTLIANYSDSTALVFWCRTLSRPICLM